MHDAVNDRADRQREQHRHERQQREVGVREIGRVRLAVAHTKETPLDQVDHAEQFHDGHFYRIG
nr:hypothetical protein [Burkholderia sp. BCC1208]